jgi:hypothetical protein
MIRRSQFLAAGLGAAAAEALRQGAGANTLVHSSSILEHPLEQFRGLDKSLELAYLFLGDMMDLYATGTTLRLAQSYVPTTAQNLGDLALMYDNAAMITALLQRGTSDDLTRAQTLGNSIVYAQAHDPLNDGRVRDGYHVDPFLDGNGSPRIAFDDNDGGSHTGNLAWAGLALARLYAKTGQSSYLSAAVAVGTWIAQNTHDLRGAGGYTDGIAQPDKLIGSKSTKANVVIFAFFNLLAGISGTNPWQGLAQHALTFIDAMWNPQSARFWLGTLSDGVTVNISFVPEDVQSWTYLAELNHARAGSLDWAYRYLRVYGNPLTGTSFSTADLSGIWFEGSANLALALQIRNATGDAGKADMLLASLQVAQRTARNSDDKGIVAASKDGLKTGAGTKYYAALHVGATSWYCLSVQAGNPFLP